MSLVFKIIAHIAMVLDSKQVSRPAMKKISGLVLE